ATSPRLVCSLRLCLFLNLLSQPTENSGGGLFKHSGIRGQISRAFYRSISPETGPLLYSIFCCQEKRIDSRIGHLA
ncbi:hypothetical protein K469DRAFT_175625, partial [Zopfia rhizophila CBS 207.26]